MGQSYCLVYKKGTDPDNIDIEYLTCVLNSMSLEGERWKDIPQYEGIYQASTLGRIRSLPRHYTDKLGRLQVQQGCILHQYPMGKYKNYRKVILRRKNRYKNEAVHRLVALTYIPNPEDLPTVDHIDKDPSNNKVTNLRWATPKEQIHHSVRSTSVKCIEDDKIFPSYAEAGRYYHVGAQYISQCANSGRRCKKINKHFKKYTIADRMSITGY